MAQTSREIVKRTLKFENPERMPRDFWVLPWASSRFPEVVEKINAEYPGDFAGSGYFYKPSTVVKGDAYVIGEYIDDWGCVFNNIQDGVIGEVRNPIISDITEWKNILKPPYAQLPKTVAEIEEMKTVCSRSYAATDKFIHANICPRPWERYQFLRGTENAMIDMMMPEEGGGELLKAIHEFYLREVELWAKTDVDGIFFMDDWGTQTQLLIPPRIWREFFKPLYKDYCDIAHANGKLTFMHSDGHISEIYEDLIEVGVDAVNSQLFCMDMADLEKRAKGKITFWGEIDRQHVLPAPDPQTARDAVRKVARHLYDPRGGLIAQFEFGPGANPECALAIFDEWAKVDAEK